MKYSLTLFLPIFLIISSLGAELQINPTPSIVIKGRRTLLSRPEGISFSPDNRCLAIANSVGKTITFYRRTEQGFERKPCSILEDLKILAFPHDVTFTPDGQHVGVASRSNHTFALYRYDMSQPGKVEETPCTVLQGDASSICYPAAVDFSPKDGTLVIANRMGSYGITCYRYLGNSKFETTPFYQVTEATFLEQNLSPPHGCGLDPSTNCIACVNKKFFKNPNARRMSGLCLIGLPSLIGLPTNEQDARTGISYVKYFKKDHFHSIAFHPSGLYFAMSSDHTGDVVLCKRDEVSGEWDPIQTLHFRPESEANWEHAQKSLPKGVAFTPDGSQLGITIVGKKPQIQIFDCVERGN